MSPELSASLANAVSMYFAGRYPADNTHPVSASGKSILLLVGQSGRTLQKHVPKSTLSKAIMELRLHDTQSYEAIRKGASMPLRKYYAWRFYIGLEALWKVLERMVDDAK